VNGKRAAHSGRVQVLQDGEETCGARSRLRTRHNSACAAKHAKFSKWDRDFMLRPYAPRVANGVGSERRKITKWVISPAFPKNTSYLDQSSQTSPFTLANSETFAVIRVIFWRTAWPAISRSYAPIGRPADSSSVRRSPAILASAA